MSSSSEESDSSAETSGDESPVDAAAAVDTSAPPPVDENERQSAEEAAASPVAEPASPSPGLHVAQEPESGNDEEPMAHDGSVERSPVEEAVAAATLPLSQEDLFGDAADLSSSGDEAATAAPAAVAVDEEAEAARLFDEDEDDDAEAPMESVIEVEAPRINVDLGSDGAYFVKFPNFLSVEPRPFDAEHYEDEIDEDEIMDEEGRSRLKLKVENTIRWRNVLAEDGSVKRESNAKMVRWSDGTMSLHLGAEVFDVHMQPVQDHNHLFVRQGAGLQGQSVFRTKLTFRPHSTDTLTHRKMTLSMADRSSKAQKVKVLAAVGADPETQKQEMVRREEERLRASARRESQQRRVRERMVGRAGLSANFLEPDREDYDSDEGPSLLALKRSYRPGGREFDRGKRAARGASDDDDDEEEEGGRADAARQLESSDDDDAQPPAEDRRRTKKKVVIEDSD